MIFFPQLRKYYFQDFLNEFDLRKSKFRKLKHFSGCLGGAVGFVLNSWFRLGSRSQGCEMKHVLDSLLSAELAYKFSLPLCLSLLHSHLCALPLSRINKSLKSWDISQKQTFCFVLNFIYYTYRDPRWFISRGFKL